MPRLRILHEAAEELAAAAASLEGERSGYARVFLEEYEAKLRQVARFPESGPRVQNSPAEHGLRSFSIRRFGYSIIVADVEDVPTIIAIAHHRREPGYWRTRLK